MSKSFIYFLLLLFSLSVNGQIKDINQIIRGEIVDEISQMPLPGATVELLDSLNWIGATTNNNGEFILNNVPVGLVDLRVRFLGYEEQILNGIRLTSGKELVIKILLREALLKLEEFEIKANKGNQAVNEMAVVSARSFSTEQSDKFPASFNDPARLALSFAGVAAPNDGSNEIAVRGNSPQGLLWRIEGIEVANPSHFAKEGSGGGAVSMLSNSTLGQSDFYTGAFPAEFGNALSGVFDLRLRKGNKEKREYTIQFGALGIQAALEGPFSKKKKASYLINYRYSTLSLVSKLGFNFKDATLSTFQDINFKFHFPTDKIGSFSLFGVLGKSRIELPISESSTKKESDKYGVALIGIQHQFPISARLHIKTTSGITGFLFDRQQEELDSNSQFFKTRDQKAENLAWTNTSILNFKLTARHQFRFGFISTLNWYSSHVNKRELGEEWDQRFFAEGKPILFQLFGQHKWRITENLSFFSGFHSLLFTLNNSFSFEPRVALNWNFKNGQSLNFGAGVHSRIAALGTYLAIKNEVQRNKDLDFFKAAHAVASYSINFASNYSFKMEAYYQYLYNVPIEENEIYSALNFNDGFTTKFLTNTGLGQNFGIEFTLEKQLYNNWYFISNLSLYESKFLAGDKVWRLGRYSGTFINNITVGKDFEFGRMKSKDRFGIHLKSLWAGGQRLVEIDELASQLAGETIENRNLGFEDRAANYFRLDLRLNLVRNKSKYSWELSLDVQNLSNNKNEARRYFDEEQNKVKVRYQLGILPVLRYKIDF